MMMLYIVSVLFKQKTAYEMRIIDWSSDVCSSDLVAAVLSEEDVTTVQTALNSIRSVLPFLVTLSGQERRELAKMGPKSVGFRSEESREGKEGVSQCRSGCSQYI